MSITYLDFALATDLTKAINSILDQDGTMEPGNVLKYTLIKQLNSNLAQITSYIQGGIWATKIIPAYGIAGTSFLVDGADLRNRISNPVWQNNALRISATKRNAVKVSRLDNAGIVEARIECACYIDDLESFGPSPEDWVEVATITNGHQYRQAVRYVINLGKHTNDTMRRSVWFYINQDSIKVYGSEHTGQSGICGISIEVASKSASNPLDFGIPARQLGRTANLISTDPAISISLDKVTNPTKVKFEGDGGLIILPLQDRYTSRVVAYSIPTLLNTDEFKSSALRVFDNQQLLGAVITQIPRKEADTQELILQEEVGETKLVINKIADINRLEEAAVLYAAAEGLNDPWVPLVCNFPYLRLILEVMLSYNLQKLKSGDVQQYLEEETTLDPDNEWALPSDTSNNTGITPMLTLTQAEIHDGSYCLFIDPVPASEECRMYLCARTIANVKDKIEGE